MQMIEVNNLSKHFGATKVIDNVSFSIAKGEIVGFLGPNGAGKTTTMRLLTGYLSPDSGKIVIQGQDLSEHISTIQTKIGYLPENNPLYKDMLVSEQLAFAAQLRNIPPAKRAQAYDFVVSAVSIADVFYRPIAELSKGYRQRVGMAVALLHQPEIIIMDEPTEGLDPNQRTEIRGLIRTLAKDRTFIISTHVMQEAAALSNRLLIINKGKIVADGTPDDLTHSASGKDRYLLEVKGSKVISTLKAATGLRLVSVDKKSASGAVVLLEADAGNTPQIVTDLLKTHQWQLERFVPQTRNLEDVFHQLTHETV